MTDTRHLRLAAVAVLAALPIAACGENELVCRPGPSAYVMMPYSSISEVESVKRAAAAVAENIAAHAAESCADVAGMVVGPRPEADWAYEPEPLTPSLTEAQNRTPIVRRLRLDAEKALQTQVLDPLAATEGTEGSPVFGALVKLANEVEAAGVAGPVCAVVVSDTVANETYGGGVIDLRLKSPTESERVALAAVAEDLRPLAGSTVLVTLGGAGSRLGPERLTRIREVFDSTLERAGVEPRWSSGTSVSEECGR